MANDDYRRDYPDIRQPDPDADLTGVEWVVAILLSGIGCILGIIWMIQGKPKAGKMLGVSLLFIAIWTGIRFAIMAATDGR